MFDGVSLTSWVPVRIESVILRYLGRSLWFCCHWILVSSNISSRRNVSFSGLGPFPIYFSDLGIRKTSTTVVLCRLRVSLRNFHCRQSCCFWRLDPLPQAHPRGSSYGALVGRLQHSALLPFVPTMVRRRKSVDLIRKHPWVEKLITVYSLALFP